ncbi:MAG: cupin domain-containing protein [Anaerolineae bacterium]|nr:cupin domain-containing protein [Anaerolineae bacterium]
MPNDAQARTRTKPYHQQQSHWRDCLTALMQPPDENPATREVNIGRRLQELRNAQGLSIRALADISGLNFNTLSLIENEKTSPNVSTLQQLASALRVPVTAFFDPSPADKDVVFQQHGLRPRTSFPHGELEDLGAGMALGDATPLLLTAKPHSACGVNPIVHTGQEFVYCLEGSLVYWVGQDEYLLAPGDSLIFQAHMPHRWANNGNVVCRCLLIICPSDLGDRSVEQHLTFEGVEA